MTALLYEYTRSASSVRQAIERWQRRKFLLSCLKDIEEFEILRDFCAFIRQMPKLTNAQAIDLVFEESESSEISEAKDHLLVQLERAASKALGSDSDTSIALRFTHLNEPWSQLQLRGERYLKERLLPAPARDVGLQGDLGPRHTYEHVFDLDPMLRHQEFIINWAVPIGSIIKDFKDWAEANQPQIPPELRRKPGKKARWERLKWLAAYRIVLGGHRTYVAGQKFLRLHAHPQDRDDSKKVLPRYPYQKSWDDAVKSAHALLHGNFAHEIKALFSVR